MAKRCNKFSFVNSHGRKSKKTGKNYGVKEYRRKNHNFAKCMAKHAKKGKHKRFRGKEAGGSVAGIKWT